MMTLSSKMYLPATIITNFGEIAKMLPTTVVLISK